jgi:hypothetical protein
VQAAIHVHEVQIAAGEPLLNILQRGAGVGAVMLWRPDLSRSRQLLDERVPLALGQDLGVHASVGLLAVAAARVYVGADVPAIVPGAGEGVEEQGTALPPAVTLPAWLQCLDPAMNAGSE